MQLRHFGRIEHATPCGHVSTRVLEMYTPLHRQKHVDCFLTADFYRSAIQACLTIERESLSSRRLTNFVCRR
jgi:hypothetical protein